MTLKGQYQVDFLQLGFSSQHDNNKIISSYCF